jgi:hypothetical protein
MPIVKSMGCSMGDVGYMGVFRLKVLTIGISRVGAVPKKSASDPWKLMPTSIF